jgi:hypothetical protein
LIVADRKQVKVSAKGGKEVTKKKSKERDFFFEAVFLYKQAKGEKILQHLLMSERLQVFSLFRSRILAKLDWLSRQETCFKIYAETSDVTVIISAISAVSKLPLGTTI